MRPKRFVSILIALAVMFVGLSAAAAAPKDAPVTVAKGPPPTTRAIVLASQTVDPKGPYARNMRDWTDRFVKLLTVRAKLPPANVRVFAETEDLKTAPPVRKGTLENVRTAFGELRKELRPVDQFILIVLGHGTVTDPVGKLCLPGRDLKATELAELLDALPTRKIVIVNCASGGAEFLEKYSSPGRVVVSATGNTGEGNQTYFAEFFLLAYETGRADANRDGTITVLEAFNRAAHRCVTWYQRQYKIPAPKDGPPGPRKVEVRTKEARRLFQKFYAGIDDLEMVTPDVDEQDDVDPPADELDDLQLRRELGEHASLEDRGENNGSLHWYDNKHHVLEGKPREQGWTAARTTLGSPKPHPPAR